MKILRQFAKRVFQALGWLDSFRWTPVHRAYVALFNRSYEANQANELKFYRSLLTRGQLVFDIGANIGSKTEVFLKLGLGVVAVEADPYSVSVLKRRFPKVSKCAVVAKAVGANNGCLPFFLDHPGGAYNTLSPQWREQKHSNAGRQIDVEVTTLQDLIRDFGVPDYIKIDIEGGERDAIAGLSIAIDLISFEANLPTFTRQTLDCIAMLGKLDIGYQFATVAVTEDGFMQNQWLTSEEISQVVISGQATYFDIYARRTGGNLVAASFAA